MRGKKKKRKRKKAKKYDDKKIIFPSYAAYEYPS